MAFVTGAFRRSTRWWLGRLQLGFNALLASAFAVGGSSDGAQLPAVVALVVGLLFLLLGLSFQPAAIRDDKTAERFPLSQLYGDSRIKADAATTGGFMIAAVGLVRLVGAWAT